jgi:hypothetical protein
MTKKKPCGPSAYSVLPDGPVWGIVRVSDGARAGLCDAPRTWARRQAAEAFADLLMQGAPITSRTVWLPPEL